MIRGDLGGIPEPGLAIGVDAPLRNPVVVGLLDKNSRSLKLVNKFLPLNPGVFDGPH